MFNKVYFGDCREQMQLMIDGGVKAQMCVTSPPYWGLRDYGVDGQLGAEKTPQEFVKNMVDVFALVHELLNDDGTLWLNLGDSYYNYRPGAGQKQGKQSIAGQKFSEVESCNKCGLKIDGLKEKDLVGIPWRVAFALQEWGWYLRQDIIWHKPNPMPESVKDRCTSAHEHIFLLSKQPKYYFDNEAIKEDAQPDTTVRDRDSTRLNNTPGRSKMGGLKVNDYEKRNKRNVWTVNTKPYSGAHFAVFPPELIEPCVLSGSKAGDVVLDPFMGSGTTAQVSQDLGRQWVGCELNDEYKSLQDARTSQSSLAFDV